MKYEPEIIQEIVQGYPTKDQLNAEPPEDYTPGTTESYLQDGATRSATISMDDTDRRITVDVEQHYRGCDRDDYRTRVKVWIDKIQEDVPDHETLQYCGETTQTHQNRCATRIAESVLSDPEALYFDATLFNDDDFCLCDWSSLLQEQTESERDRRQRQHDGLTMQL